MEGASRWPLLAGCFARLGIPVVIVDLESTGGNLYQDRVTEVAILRFENGQVARYEWLVNPQQPISGFITGLTGIDDAMVADAPVFAELVSELLPLLRGALLVAHNSRFDYTFLRHEFQRAGVDFAAPALCTVQLSRRLYPQFHKHNLDSIIERFGLMIENRHRAMTDVLALTDFLEKSVTEKGAEEWENHCRALMNPKMLPTWLPTSFSEQLYALPDTYGVLTWLDRYGQALAVEAHERTFSEISYLLHAKKVPVFAQSAASVKFLPALGGVHALWLKAQVATEYRLRPSENLKNYLTVQFAPDEQSRLQARIVPLSNGSRQSQPCGLFLHKKAAKRALAVWAKEHELCPSSLDILPVTRAKDVPCPVQEIGQCNGHCYTEKGVQVQNSRILERAKTLPVADWGRAHTIEIVETDALSRQSITLRCAGGALALPDGRWYFDETLPMLLKAKFKQGKEAVRVLA
ncbi:MULTISPECIES: exonuclease domain-containing protein [unclassified Neisseria]|uniref:exonuclease domain-containing protein n=1 Tax=unclassified Neisseria TaxID=2623750 RepID=UPI002664EFA8|nr:MULTISPECIES: exonuclease domain-containing protein [unclassified Neisseria]MDO1510478.1 exonuclease domain-containing protein [Neisseria sp. MVDL19-042950]MDO1516647.1 exonuclease domain-containing protein [Neisseria sp. MVDL18-041461]MDO1563793.1 exonuclease domain-containing protein [Neisseria sp. MVDL20-010259]